MPATAAPPATGRSLGYGWFAAIVVAYLAIIQLIGRLAAAVWDAGDGITTTRDVVINMWIPLGLALAFTYALIAYLGWWRPVFHEPHRVRRWVWAVPVILVVSIVLAIDYPALLGKDAVYVLALLVATQIVGWGEEGMFRGVGVETLRRHGLTEGKVAFWSSVIFGAVHLSNALGTGERAIFQAAAVSFAGYFFYLTRRVSGSNWLNSVLHGLFDFAILSGAAIVASQSAYAGSAAVILAYVVIAVLVIVRRKKIELPATVHGLP